MIRKEICRIVISAPRLQMKIWYTMICATSEVLIKYLTQSELATGGKPSTGFPPERLVELICLSSKSNTGTAGS